MKKKTHGPTLYVLVITILLAILLVPSIVPAEIGHWMVWEDWNKIEKAQSHKAIDVYETELCLELRFEIKIHMERHQYNNTFALQNEIRANTLVLIYTRLGCNMQNLAKDVLEE